MKSMTQSSSSYYTSIYLILQRLFIIFMLSYENIFIFTLPIILVDGNTSTTGTTPLQAMLTVTISGLFLTQNIRTLVCCPTSAGAA